MEIEANSAEEAIKRLGLHYYSEDFQKKATICVFDKAPVFTKHPDMKS